MIFYLCSILIILYSFVNFKRGFIIFLAFKLLLVRNITLISIPGIPLLTLDMFMSLLYSFWFFLFKKKYSTAKYSFPYMSPGMLLMLSWTLSALFSVAGFSSEISVLIGDVANEFLLLIAMWETLEDKEDFDFLFGMITIVIFASCIYALVEYKMQTNPLQIYEMTLNKDPLKIIDFGYGIDKWRGYHVQSIFEHAITAGIIWALYSVFVMTSIVKYNEPLRFKAISVVTAILCLLAVILTKQRAGLVFFFIAALSFFKPKKKKLYVIFALVAIGMVFISPYLIDNINILLSLFSSKAQSQVGGSDASMRWEQLNAAFQLFFKAPLFGLGSKFDSVINNRYVRALLGGESIWFSVIPGYGLLGIVSYLYSAYWMLYKIPKYFRSIELFWVSVAYWVVRTLTSVPGMKVYLIYLFFIYFIKKSDRYKVYKGLRQNEWRLQGTIVHHKNVFK
ncbi:MAG: O-antigen ligase family protein [Eubacterium sp.]|nr:O-antigen ligase family protein [Eubacterium sp.]